MKKTLRTTKSTGQRGFTFVEVVIIAPIVILAIGAFIAVVVSMTTDVLRSRAANVLSYNVQDALNRIQQDVKLSTTFLAQSNVDLSSTNQGYDDGTAVFNNTEPPTTPKGQMLILNALATTDNPISNNSQVAYLSNQPNACGTNQAKNTPLTYNIIYYVKTVNGVSSLWRRTVMPSGYATSACNALGSTTPGIAAPWQQPSCTPTTSGTFTNPFCKTNDQRLVDGVSPNGFTLTYYARSSSTTASTTATTGSDAPTRQTALASATTVSASIDAIQSVGGQNVEQNASIRATRLDTNASTIGSTVTPTTPSTPVVTASYAAPASATFSWPIPSGNGTITYTASYTVDGGAPVNALTNSSLTTFTVNAGHNHVISATVYATNSAGPSLPGTASITVPLWATPTLLNSWSDYSPPFTAAGYTKTSAGMIVLKGLVRGGNTSGVLPIFNLPVGYRPSEQLIFQNSTNSAAGRVDVATNGDVLFEVGNNAWYSLDGITFMPSGTTFTSLTSTFANGWTTYSSPFALPEYMIDSLGRVHLNGLIRNGTTTSGTVMVTLPSSAVPALYSHFSADNGNANSHFSIDPANNGVVAKGYGNSYQSLQAIYLPGTYPTSGSCPIATTGWCALSFQNSWKNYTTPPYASGAYTKSSDGEVELKGLLNGGTIGAVIAQLPVGYRPKEQQLLTVESNGAWGRLDIDTSGNLIAAGGSNTWFSLDGIAFMSEQ